ncbi:ABC transporter permease [Paenibacillus favisporus]|uniref:ABC transporter permease n=1 Tax=Paenibacillus favisporus TaxID=221028 RepID=UPI002DB76261|nr:ABC transporter permease [Paenibacillus favisporus]MEC0179247.1 ABC transporter permease [Paenibacillus favisporus]
MNKLGTIIGFTFKNKARTKSFLITTLILALLITIGMNVPYIIKLIKGDDASKAEQIGILYGSQPVIAAELEKYAAQSGNKDYTFVKYEGTAPDQAKKDLEDGKIEGYLSFDGGEGAFPAVTFTGGEDGMGQGITSFLMPALQTVKTTVIAKDALSAEQIAALNEPVKLDTVRINAEGKTEAGGDTHREDMQKAMNYVVVYVLLILFFTSNMMTGNMIAAEVTSEKSSRIMEILITSVSPLAQMFGKVIGIFLVGIVQIAVFGVVVGANLMLPHNQDILQGYSLSISDINLPVLLYGLVFYILGYFLYAVLYAAIGSIVSRTEDLGQAVMPITMLGLASFYIGLFSITASGSMLIKVTSFIPFTAPTAMLVRIGMGTVPTWQILISLVLLLVSILFFGWLSAKIYRTGVLMYGKRPSIKELRKAMKAYKI